MKLLILLGVVLAVAALSEACDTNSDCDHTEGTVCCNGQCQTGNVCCGIGACNSVAECCAWSDNHWPSCCSGVCCKKYVSNWCCGAGQKCGDYNGHCL